MGGFQTITAKLNGLPRKVHCWYDGSNVYAHVGTNVGIQQVVFNAVTGDVVSIADRTPKGFLGGPNTSITFDAIYDTTSSVVQLVAHAGQSNGFLASPSQTVPFLGQISSPTMLAPFSEPTDGLPLGGVWTQPNIAGGVACVQPFVFDFDNNGLVQWSAPNLPLYLGVVGGTSGAGQARISAQKIVACMALRGGGSASPAAIFWSLSEVIVATYVGTPVWFAFNTVSPSSSILSSACVIEYDGLYFWAGIDRFLVFNGTVAEVPNTFNQDFFFNNLTPGFEGQTFAFKIPRYGEIWWVACLFGSTVPNWAIIYNLRENCWYDTPVPTTTWSAGFFAQGFPRPLAAGQDKTGAFKLWMCEAGTDYVDGPNYTAIRSYFETALFGGPKNDLPNDQAVSIAQLEPDVLQTGNLIVYLKGQANARAPSTNGPNVPLLNTPLIPQRFPSFTPKQSQRLTQLHLECNERGASYIVGRNLMRGTPAEGTTTF